MAHTQANKKKLLARIRRIQGQLRAVERGLDQEDSCYEILQLITSSHGALKGLMHELIEGHIRQHVLNPDSSPATEQVAAGDELIQILRTYLK